MGFLGAVHSELVKVKHTPFWTMHLCLPVVGALLFIVYYVLYGSTADEIYGTDKAEAVAVNVNDNYYIAKRQ